MKIIRDTREQYGFFTDPFVTTAEIIVRGLKAGDYSIEGLEHFVCIERKASTGELYGNLAKESSRNRFHREMEKLAKIKYRYILCEFSEICIHTFPEGSGIPIAQRANIKVSAKYLRKLIYEVEEKYDIKFIYCASRSEAERTTFLLLEKAWGEWISTNSEST